MNHRLWKIDTLRGVAIIGMVLFHANYMLVSLFSIDILDFSQTFWFYLGKVVVILFIVLAGMSLYLSSYGRSWWYLLTRVLRRAGLFGFLALSISLVTYDFFYEVRISWGILHFFTLSTLLKRFSNMQGFSTAEIELHRALRLYKKEKEKLSKLRK